MNQNFNLGALGAGTVVIQNLFDNTGQEMYIISSDLTWSIVNGEEDSGPINVGLAHGDYTLTEIDEWFVSNAGIAGDEIALEQSRRKVRQVGDIIVHETGTGGTGTGWGQLEGGMKIRTRMGWFIAPDVDLALWARNSGDAALATTTADLTVSGNVYLRLV